MEEEILLEFYFFLMKASFGDYELTEFVRSNGTKYQKSYQRYLTIYRSFFNQEKYNKIM